MNMEIIREAGCRCTWCPRNMDTGAQVEVVWELCMIDRSCPLHGVHAQTREYAETVDATS